MLVSLAEPTDGLAWNDFVSAHPLACVYHRFEWGALFQRVYSSKPVYLVARRGRTVTGVLPMIELSSRLFGRILSSMPYFGHGGMLVEDECVAEALEYDVDRIARRHGARYVELRHLEEHDLGWYERRDKVNMLLDLPRSADTLFAGFKSKLRSQIRRPERAGHVIRDGRHDLLHPFWLVYSENMRDLGSPCHSERLFGAILDTFGERSRVFVVFDGDTPIAGGLVVGRRGEGVGDGILEIPCASSLRAFNKTSPNMMLYGRILRYACDEGYGKFNFGRSTFGAGTYRFKRQWGAQPWSLIYNIWTPPGAPPPNLRPDNPKMHLAVEAWKKLPLAVSRLAGPGIAKGIP